VLHGGADRDRQGQAARTVDEAERARVDSARAGLERFDQRQGGLLRCACDAAGREGAREQRAQREPWLRASAHRADQVREPGERQHAERILDLDAAALADSAQIVAHQVDHHRVLGMLLVVAAQGVGLACIVPAARDRALDGRGPERAIEPVVAQEALHAAAEHGVTLALVEIAERHRALGAHAQEQPERRAGKTSEPAPRQVHLVNVAVADAAQRLFDGRGVLTGGRGGDRGDVELELPALRQGAQARR
jgi:hypothetical protein